MKQLIFIFVLFSTTTFSQNFEEVDKLVLNYPRFSRVEDLANRIKKDFLFDHEKARAAFYWLTQNIYYDLKEYYNPRQRRYRIQFSSEEEKNFKLQAIKDQLVSDMFRNKKGVCEEYAQAFKKICDLLNLEAAVIKGYTRNNVQEISTNNKIVNHAWNAVKINDKWLLLDATWAAGFNEGNKWVRKFNPYFYDIPKEKIFKSHYPEETIWVLRFGRMSLDEFYDQPLYKPSFLELQSELMSPKTGIIRVNSSKEIILKFKNFDSSLFLSYQFTGEKTSRRPIVKTTDHITTVTIQNPKRNTDLVLFINRNDALHYKIRMR